MTAIQRSVRERYLDFMDDWQAGERHLPYTLVAVTLVIVAAMLTIMPAIRADDSLPATKRELLAERFVAEVSKVKGVEAPSVDQAVLTYGENGGATCTDPIPALHKGLIVRPKGRASYLDRAAQHRLRAAFRVYCPKRDASYATWLKKRSA